ncbi:MAG: class A beta-lactamase-related serine hydrolase [Chloroflexota bacterium]|nr:class A beta-lactamase-related serine hydrolase [Chloroflexota bacterium]
MNVADLAGEILAAWDGLAASCAFRIAGLRPGGAAHEHRADEPMEVGSCFKAFVAAECCRRVERGTLRWDEALVLTADLRVPSRAALDALPDGATAMVREAAAAMIVVSDNTATDLLLRRPGIGGVRSLVAEAGLAATRLPKSVRAVYDAGEADPDGRAEASVSTMRDLTRFYARAFGGGIFAEPATLDAFKEIMRQEDLDQATAWPAGVRCYRKSGYLAPPPLLGTGMAGAFEANGRVVPFAFACNVALDDVSVAAGIMEGFTRGVGRGIPAVADALAG